MSIQPPHHGPANFAPGSHVAVAAARWNGPIVERLLEGCVRRLAELGAQVGVIPEAEVWGFSKSMSRLAETVMIAMESGHAKACVLPDVYHLFKGGSGFDSLRFLQGKAIGILHVNDYPKDKDRTIIKDADRVFPGDGVAPLADVFRTLRDIGYRGMLSLELFNPEYYKRDAFEVVKEGLQKTKAAVKAALS